MSNRPSLSSPQESPRMTANRSSFISAGSTDQAMNIALERRLELNEDKSIFGLLKSVTAYLANKEASQELKLYEDCLLSVDIVKVRDVLPALKWESTQSSSLLHMTNVTEVSRSDSSSARDVMSRSVVAVENAENGQLQKKKCEEVAGNLNKLRSRSDVLKDLAEVEPAVQALAQHSEFLESNFAKRQKKVEIISALAQQLSSH